MGIDVLSDKDKKIVTFNATHEHLVNTKVEHNPIVYELSECCRVSCIFQRRKSRSGDGNPLIYALKRKKGYSISMREVARFLKNFYAILDKILENKAYDIIVPMPSSHSIALNIANRISRRITSSTIILESWLQKKTVGEVLPELEKLLETSSFSGQERHLIKQLIATLEKAKGKVFSMKEVHNMKIRKYINPLTLCSHSTDPQIKPLRIIIVDDLVASGSTLNAAVKLLKEVYPNSSIEGICLLSKL